MLETVELYIMGDFWRRETIKWGPGRLRRRVVSIPCKGDNPSGERFFRFIRFAPHCYTFTHIADFPHYHSNYFDTKALAGGANG